MILSYKQEISLLKMDQEENQSMENTLTMKIFSEDTLMLDFFQWLIMEEIQIHHSFLLLLNLHLI